jgi:hypothetical protein
MCRVVKGACLESKWSITPRGFESRSTLRTVYPAFTVSGALNFAIYTIVLYIKYFGA